MTKADRTAADRILTATVKCAAGCGCGGREGFVSGDAQKAEIDAIAEEHDVVVRTWFGVGLWPTCKCGFAPRDNDKLTAHWRTYGFRVVDEHGRLMKRPVAA